MTWFWPPAGIEFKDGGRTDTVSPIPASTNDYLCALVDGSFATCYHHEVFLAITEEAPISTALAEIPDVYDWYAISIVVGFPHVQTAYEECWSPPTIFHQGCKNNTTGDSSGFLDCTLKEYATGAAADNTGASPGLGASWDINERSGAAVVNPSPTYPIPDSTGNEAGEILWTRAQLEALEVNFIYGGHWGNGAPNHNVLVSIFAYNEIAPDITHAEFMCLL